jgi:hypothetical protein
MGYEPERWHDLFVMVGGASAALAGLVFLGLSMHARAVASERLYPLRARNLTAGILYVTVASMFVLIPGQDVRVLGAELIAAGSCSGRSSPRCQSGSGLSSNPS